MYSYPKNPDFLSWCTSFPDDSNMFGTYFERGGTSLFYFLPINDPEGLNKFCVGVTKVTTGEGQFDLICGGHTTVGFENVAFIKDGSDFTSNEVKQKILKKFGKLGLTKEMLNVIQTKVSGRNPFDRYAYIGKLKPAELAAAINMNTIGATDDGKNSIKTQIESIFKTYEDPEFLKDYQPNPKIIAVINKDVRYWTECNVDIKYLPEKYASDKNFWVQLFLTTNYSNDKEIKNKSTGQYFDYLQKMSTQNITVDFVINFIEEFLNTCVANNLYSKKDPSVLQAEFEKLYQNRYDSEKASKKLDTCYNTAYDNFIIYSKFSDVPTETIMTWSDADILKYFNYQNNIKKTYPVLCVKHKKRILSSTQGSALAYFIRSVGNITYTTDELKKVGRIKAATLRNYSQYLLSTLFSNYEDYKSFCKSNLNYNPNINILNLLKYPLNHEMFINELLYPTEWMTDELVSNIDFSLNRISEIKDENIDEFISDNENVLKKHFPTLVKGMLKEYSDYLEDTSDNPLELIQEKFNEDYGVLKKYDVILKGIKDIEFQNNMQGIDKINNFVNGNITIKNDLIEYLKNSALQFNSLKSLPVTNSNTIFNFIKQFERGIFEFLISNKQLLLTTENSLIITEVLKENNALELSTCQNFFWDLLRNPNLAITDIRQIATFLKSSLIDDKNFIFADINNNTIQIFDNQKDKKAFVNSNIFQNFLDGLQQFIIKTQNPNFIRSILVSYVGHYNPMALSQEDINKLITYLFPDSVSIMKRKLLFDTIVNVIMNDFYPEYFSKQALTTFLENFNLTNITIPNRGYEDENEDEDDDVNESIKFKLGNKILTERQLRSIIRNLI